MEVDRAVRSSRMNFIVDGCVLKCIAGACSLFRLGVGSALLLANVLGDVLSVSRRRRAMDGRHGLCSLWVQELARCVGC